jgi:hypothetical protein
MSISLHAATVPSYQQILGSMAGLLDRAQSYCQEQSLAPETLLQARLADDMFPFAKQITATVVHSIGAIEGAQRGVFSPDLTPPPTSFAELGDRVSQARASLDALNAADVDGLFGKAMQFVFGEHKIDYRAENFLLSFSQPNFYFHASTAYGILRMKGMLIGKGDFIGQRRTGL